MTLKFFATAANTWIWFKFTYRSEAGLCQARDSYISSGEKTIGLLALGYDQKVITVMTKKALDRSLQIAIKARKRFETAPGVKASVVVGWRAQKR
ncbi:MAG TPA: hypothetical protein VNL14_17615 [Candidatus Acidoferrales bacterium]|nr:hypothetical protein [Candidatus Acidoferrales bacterium]